MKPLDFPLLADENIHPEVVAALAAKGKKITSVLAEGLAGREDREILHHAHVRGVLEVLEALDVLPFDTVPSFLVVAERREQVVRVRVRSSAEGSQP